MQPPKRHGVENPYTYLISAANVPEPVLKALCYAVDNELAFVAHRLLILNPCGHSIHEKAAVPRNCTDCSTNVVSWLRDDTIRMVLESMKEVIEMLKERRLKRYSDAVDISRVIKLGVQYEHAFILYCRHSVSLSKVKDVASKVLGDKVAFKDNQKICFCNSGSTYALANHNLRRVSAIIARLHPFMNCPPAKVDPKTLPEIAILKVEFQCLNILNAQISDNAIPFEETVKLCALLKKLPLSSFVWDQVGYFIRNNLQPENQQSLLELLKVLQEMKFEGFKPLHLDICSTGRVCIRTGQFVRALFISCLLHKAKLSSEGLENQALGLLINCPYSAAFHLIGRFISFMTEKDKSELIHFFFEKISFQERMWAPKSVEYVLEDTYAPYLGEIDRAVVERLDCVDLYNPGRTNSCQNAWRFTAFLTYCADPFLRQLGINLAWQALNKKTIPFNSQGVTNFIVQRLEALSKESEELNDLVGQFKVVRL